MAIRGRSVENTMYISAPLIIGSKRRWITIIHNKGDLPSIITVFFGSIRRKWRVMAIEEMEAMADKAS